MCLREWCLKCFCDNPDPESSSESLNNALPAPVSCDGRLPEEEGGEERDVSPPGRPNRTALSAVLREQTTERQISSISEDSPEQLRRQTLAFKGIQSREEGGEGSGDRSRAASSPGQLERSPYTTRSEDAVGVGPVEMEQLRQSSEEKAISPGTPMYYIPAARTESSDLEDVGSVSEVGEREELMRRLTILREGVPMGSPLEEGDEEEEEEDQQVNVRYEGVSITTEVTTVRHREGSVKSPVTQVDPRSKEELPTSRMESTDQSRGTGSTSSVRSPKMSRRSSRRSSRSSWEVLSGHGSEPPLYTEVAGVTLSRRRVTSNSELVLDQEVKSGKARTKKSSKGTGQVVTNVDIRGTVRGRCTACEDCTQYEIEKGYNCNYCGCPPAKHEKLGHYNPQMKAIPSLVQQQAQQAQQSLPHHAHHSAPTSQHYQHTTLDSSPPARSLCSVPVRPRSSNPGTWKSLTVADFSALPGFVPLEDALRFLQTSETDLQQSQRHSTPDLLYRSHVTSDNSDFGSNVAVESSAYDSLRRPVTSPPAISVSPPPGEEKSRDEVEESPEFEEESEEPITTSSRSAVTLRPTHLEGMALKISPWDGEDIVRGILKESIKIRVEIFPAHIKKHHVTWLHNHKRISPRYRVRFENDRREVHILSLRKKDAGIYTCRIKYNDGSAKQQKDCTIILDVSVPTFTVKPSF